VAACIEQEKHLSTASEALLMCCVIASVRYAGSVAAALLFNTACHSQHVCVHGVLVPVLDS
jgi:hypothetical protein